MDAVLTKDISSGILETERGHEMIVLLFIRRVCLPGEDQMICAEAKGEPLMTEATIQRLAELYEFHMGYKDGPSLVSVLVHFASVFRVLDDRILSDEFH